MPLMVKGKELKIAQVWSDMAQRGATGYTYCINKIAEGTDLTERIGRHCTMKYVDLVVMVSQPVQSYDAIRVMLVHDRMSLGVTATSAEILETSVIASLYMQPLNAYLMASRFSVLLDHRFPWIGAGTSYPPNTVLAKRVPIPKHLQHTVYGASTSDEPVNGALIVLLCGYKSSATADNNGLVGYSAVVRWIDD